MWWLNMDFMHHILYQQIYGMVLFTVTLHKREIGSWPMGCSESDEAYLLWLIPTICIRFSSDIQGNILYLPLSHFLCKRKQDLSNMILSPSLSSLSLLSGSLGVYHGRLSLTQIYLTSVESSMCLMGWGLPVYRQPYEDATMPDSGESCPEGAWHDACNHGSPPVSLSLLSRGAESKMGKEETERESLKSSPSPLSSWQSWKGSFGRSEMAFNNCSFTDLPRSVSMTQKENIKRREN